MLKIKELLKSFIETQNQINESLKGLREDLKPKLDEIKITADKLNTCSFIVDRLDNCIESNVYTKDATIEAINKEYDYRKEYERCSKENDDLLKMVEKYCRYEDKYEVLKIFDEINKNYVVEKVSDEEWMKQEK